MPSQRKQMLIDNLPPTEWFWRGKVSPRQRPAQCWAQQALALGGSIICQTHAFGWGINLKQETPSLVEFTEYCILAALATPRKYLLVKCYLITCLPAKSPLDHWGQKPFFPFTAIIPTTSRRVWNTVDRWSGDVCGNERSILTESQRRGLGNCAYMWCICYIHKYLRWFTNSDKY